MKPWFTALLSLLVAATSFAANTQPIEEAFNRYWSAYAKKDFAKAAADILPSDLDEAKNLILPVFVAGQASKNKAAQELCNAFFGRTVGKARETMSGAEVFAGLNRIMAATNPDLFEAFKEATTSIIFVRTPDADNAEVHFQISVRGQGDIDAEKLTRKNGRWWVRFNDDPKEIAKQFKELFARP